MMPLLRHFSAFQLPALGSALMLTAAMAFAPAARADDLNAVLSGGVGAAAGALIGQSIGGRDGAIIGAAVGGAAGVSIGSQRYEKRTPYVVEHVHYEEHDWREREWKHRHHHDEWRDNGHGYGRNWRDGERGRGYADHDEHD